MVQYITRPAVLSLVPKGQRVSQIAALSENGFVHSKVINSEGDKKRGVNARGSVFILDNARIHHSDRI